MFKPGDKIRTSHPYAQHPEVTRTVISREEFEANTGVRVSDAKIFVKFTHPIIGKVIHRYANDPSVYELIETHMFTMNKEDN